MLEYPLASGGDTVEPDDATFLQAFYKQLRDDPVEPDDPRYQPIYADEDVALSDPLQTLLRGIIWGEEQGAHLFSGFRGVGKSTELRRLRQRLLLEDSAKHVVALCDMSAYINLTTPIDVSDFLLAAAGAFGDALTDDAMLGRDPGRPGYWERFARFMTAEIRLDDFKLKGGTKEVGAEVKVSLKRDPGFRELLQDRMKGHIAALHQDVCEFFVESVAALRGRHGANTRVVLLLDTLERIQGTSTNEHDVQASVENLFARHADKLHLPAIHVVYTVPPWLKIRAHNVANLYQSAVLLPCLKVHDPDGIPFQAGLDAACALVERRGDWQRLLGSRATLERLVGASGGHLRDLFRLLRACMVTADAKRTGLPVPERVVELAIQELRNSYTPISNEDARWLHEIHRHHTVGLEDGDHLPALARLFDNHLVLCYRNGTEWYDVHPAVLGDVERLAGAGGLP